MKQMIIFLVYSIFGLSVSAQILMDSTLNQQVRQILIEDIQNYVEDVDAAGVVVMNVKSGNVKANVSIGKDLKDIPEGNDEPIPCGIGRAVLYLSLMDYLTPDFVVDTGGGLHVDSITGCVIKDMNYDKGGYGTLTLKKALDFSDVGIIKAAEVAFNKNTSRLGRALMKTGVFFESIDDEDEAEDYQESEYSQPWRPCEIIGYKSPYSSLQQCAWVNMVANGGKLMLRLDENDSKDPICEVNIAGLNSLKAAMLEVVENGTGKMMKSSYMNVAGIANVSPVDGMNCRSCFAAAFFPAEDPQYTVCCFVNKHGLPAGRIIPTKITGNIIDFMSKSNLGVKGNAENRMIVSMPKQERIRPYEK